jgi:hypothetical protein
MRNLSPTKKAKQQESRKIQEEPTSHTTCKFPKNVSENLQCNHMKLI